MPEVQSNVLVALEALEAYSVSTTHGQDISKRVVHLPEEMDYRKIKVQPVSIENNFFVFPQNKTAMLVYLAEKERHIKIQTRPSFCRWNARVPIFDTAECE